MGDVDEYDVDIHTGPSSLKGESILFGDMSFDDTDMFLIAILKDMVLAPEFCWSNPNNVEYGGCYRVRDYQVKFNRVNDHYAGFSCARSVGKTEREMVFAFTHLFRRSGENLLITAPELLHLQPLAKAIEDRVDRCRLTRECLRRDRAGQTGFSHNPFGVELGDGTKIVGRIPNKDGRGVKGQHQIDLIVEEAQDYPDAGWTEVHEMQSLDSDILTPSGFVKMRDISVGDSVIGLDGSPNVVTGESEVCSDREVYEVGFHCGSVVECDADHLWSVARPHHIHRGQTVLMTTSQILDDMKSRKSDETLNPFHLWRTPELSVPVEFVGDEDLDVDPYLLGVLLGDGCFKRTGSIWLSTADEDLLDLCSERLHVSEEFHSVGGYSYIIRFKKDMKFQSRLPTRLGIKKLGLLGLGSQDKFVPHKYKVSSIESRLLILQGLVDSDGSIDRHGAVRFVTTSKMLRDDIMFIARSLGGSATYGLVKKELDRHLDKWCVRIRVPDGVIPSLMERKASLVKKLHNGRTMQRRITSIVPTGVSKPMKCISVDSEDGLYVTNDFIVTHNTVMKERDYNFHFYGVHRGARGGGFARRVQGGMFKIHSLTAIQRPTWGPEEKRAAIDTYGGVNSPDYRRNILGEPGAASSPIFVVSRLMACVDQSPDSDYNTNVYSNQHFRWEDFSQSGITIDNAIDLPYVLKTKKILVGMDLGLTNSPTVCSIFAEIDHRMKGEHAPRKRLALIRRITLQHFKSKDIRHLAYLIWKWRRDLYGIGMDITGLGFPIFQEIEDDETYPEEFRRSVMGWKFNEKITINIESESERRGIDPGSEAYFQPEEEEQTKITVIEATTNNLREWVDSNYLLLPMDNEVVEDLLAENLQRVQDVSRLTGTKKPNRFHILDSFRMATLVEKLHDQVQVSDRTGGPVLDAMMDDRML